MTSSVSSQPSSGAGVQPAARGHRKELIGRVVSTKMMKTVVVEVDRLVRHPQYEQVIRRRTRLQVHNPDGKAQLGDRIRIRECHPISRHKRWLFIEKLAA